MKDWMLRLDSFASKIMKKCRFLLFSELIQDGYKQRKLTLKFSAEKGLKLNGSS